MHIFFLPFLFSLLSLSFVDAFHVVNKDGDDDEEPSPDLDYASDAGVIKGVLLGECNLPGEVVVSVVIVS